VASVSHLAPIHLGLDVHRDTISVGVLTPDQQVPEVDQRDCCVGSDRVQAARLLA